MIFRNILQQPDTDREYVVRNHMDISHIGSNKVQGDISLIDDAGKLDIVFKGSNNILYLEKGIKHLRNLSITFSGNNSLVFISKSRAEYTLKIEMESDSVCFIGPHMYTSKMKTLNLNVRNGDMVLTGADCLFSLAIEIDTSARDKEDHGDIFIGNHVWIGQNAKVYGNSVIHSGAVIGAQAVIDGQECTGNACWVTRNGELAKLTDGVVFTKDSMRAVVPAALNKFDYIEEELRKKILEMEEDDICALLDTLHDIKTANGRLKFIKKTAGSRVQTRAPQLSEYVDWCEDTDLQKDTHGNRIIGDFEEAEGNSVVFEGSGNILFIEPGAKLKDCRIIFHYDNSLVYLSRSDNPYHFRLYLHYNSTVFFGRNMRFSERSPLRLNASEAKNVLIGDEVRIGKRVWIRTSDQHPLFDIESGQRINGARGVVVGDNARIANDTVVRKGSVITGSDDNATENLKEALEKLNAADDPENKLAILKSIR